MKLALHVNDFNWAGGPNYYRGQLMDIAQAGEAAGFTWLCVADHLWQAPQGGGPEVPELECYTTLAFLAAHTGKSKLMAVVTAVPFRQPGLLAKMVTTLDVLSGGCAWLGIGAGFSATGMLKRSDWGVSYWGLMIRDDVKIEIEVEAVKPAAVQAAA